MATVTAVSPLTYDDLDVIPQQRAGDRHELFEGKLVVTPSPAPPHQRAAGRVYRSFAHQVDADDLGEVFIAPIDVVFAPKVVAVPDVVFVRRERLGIVGAKAIDGVPDLIVEVLSPSTRRRDLGAKKALYARFGVPEYWTLDLTRQAVAVYVLGDGRYRCLDRAAGTLRSTVIPELHVEVASLFAGL